ncbi:MAG: hypothetical protein QXL96_09050 [Ignisphaera sp.]
MTVDVILKCINESFELVKQREIKLHKVTQFINNKLIAGFLVRKFVGKFGYRIWM